VNKKICFLAGQLGLGGAEKQLYYLIKELILKNFHVTVIDFYPEQNGYWRKPLEAIGVELISYYRQPRLFRFIRILCYLRLSKPDVIHGWHFHTNPYANFCGKLCKIPLRIGSIRENPNYWPNSFFLQFFSIFGLDYIVSNSSVSTNETLKKFKRFGFFHLPNIVTIHNFVEKSEGDYDKLFFESTLQSMISYIKKEHLVSIIGVGRFNINKNWQLLINAVGELFASGKKIFLLLIGDGPEKDKLISLVSNMGLEKNVKIIESVPNSSLYFDYFDIFCLCSHLEGMPNVIMEASISGLPIVATNVGGVKEIVENDLSGYLIEDNDLEELVNKLSNLIDNEEKRIKMGNFGKQKMKMEFSFEKSFSEIYKLYSK
jgi:glycosyltransferase involved in cell wall biosynthesis